MVLVFAAASAIATAAATFPILAVFMSIRRRLFSFPPRKSRTSAAVPVLPAGQIGHKMRIFRQLRIKKDTPVDVSLSFAEPPPVCVTLLSTD